MSAVVELTTLNLAKDAEAILADLKKYREYFAAATGAPPKRYVITDQKAKRLAAAVRGAYTRSKRPHPGAYRPLYAGVPVMSASRFQEEAERS